MSLEAPIWHTEFRMVSPESRDTYYANGNLVAGAGRTVAFDSLDRPITALLHRLRRPTRAVRCREGRAIREDPIILWMPGAIPAHLHGIFSNTAEISARWCPNFRPISAVHTTAPLGTAGCVWCPPIQ
jgi:hypothetical protein